MENLSLRTIDQRCVAVCIWTQLTHFTRTTETLLSRLLTDCILHHDGVIKY